MILPFDIEMSLDTAGGKGYNLSRLVRAGLPIPPGFVISTAAYTSFVQANDLDVTIQAALHGLAAGDPGALEAASQVIRARFSAFALSDDLAYAIRDAYDRLGRPPVAVRSSATAEDLPGLSFAGQQDTYLNVVGQAALERAVVACWSSLWTARAIGYRTRSGIDHGVVSLAVVIQEMVPSETSGVLFTANPLSGRRDETVIDATFGLGEALVSGQVEPDHYVVDAQGRILSKTLGAKAVALHARDGGGTRLVEQDAAGQQALADAVIGELAAMGRHVAELFGVPQDIEWAGVDGRLYLLQSRPITTLYPVPEGMPPQPLRAMLSFGSVQGMLDPMTPFGRDTFRATLAGAGRIFDAQLTMETQTVFREAGERLWIDITGLICNRFGRRVLLVALPLVDPAANQILKRLMDQGRFSTPGPLRLQTIGRLLRVFVPILGRFLHTALRPDAQRERLFRQLSGMLVDLEARFAEARSLTGRLALIQEMAELAFVFVIPQFVPRFAVAMASYNLLTHMAATLPEQTIDTRIMMRGVANNVTTEMDLALWNTAQAIRADAESLAHFQAHDVAALADQYLRGGLPRPAQASIAAFLERYGARGLAEIDMGRPRWRDEPLPIFQTLSSYLDITGIDQAPDAVFERGKQAAKTEIDRLAAALRATPGGRAKAWLVRRAAYRMRALIGLREAPKFTVILIFGIMRRALLADGAALVERGLLAHSTDLFYLHMAELRSLAAGEQRDWIALVQARRQTWAQEQRRRQIPRLLLSTGDAFYEGVSAAQAEDSTAIHGEPVSPGVVENFVHVVLDPRNAQLVPGEILVCPGTDPSWTPLFLAAGGLVMEVGGMMTHGAVVAREYGLPAVVGVHQATQRLRTGQRVRMDGSSGQITLLED